LTLDVAQTTTTTTTEADPTIDAARRGDRSACALLLRNLQDPWFRVCLGLLGGDAERARDATQETAVRFLRELPRFRGDSRLRTWSIGIAINVVREIRRASGATVSLGDGIAAMTWRPTGRGPSPLPSPAGAAEAAERREVIQSVLAALPPRQREAVVLRFFEELSVEETAAAMDCAPGTVKATVHQAIKSLREKLRLLA
jgi:RNA polymerase sigma factor (sigma-70 family)